MDNKYREMLKIPADRLDAINAVLLDPNSKVMQGFMDVVAKYGTPEEINAKANEAGKLREPAQEGASRSSRNISKICNGWRNNATETHSSR